MGENYMQFFPADPRLPKPDWRRLREQLLERGLIKPPRQGGGITYTPGSFWRDIGHDRAIPDYHKLRIKDISQLVDALKNAAIVPRDFGIEHDGTTIAELASALRNGGLVSSELALSYSEQFDIGPAFADFCEPADPEFESEIVPSISYDDFGNRIAVRLGPECLFEPPGIPGTDRAVEEWMEFIDRWTKNPNEQWIDPETGQGYGILDLEWENTLGAGKCMLEVFEPRYLNPLKVVALLGDLTGIPFKFCWYSI
jgi:hypothetical protein